MKEFQVEIGLSDHTIGNTAAITAVALGATAIEKHFTLDRNDASPDSSFSIEPSELIKLKKSTNEAWKSLGMEEFSNQKGKANKGFRRSIYFIKSLKKGI